MPIYEYQCQQCQHKLEVMQRVNDAPLKTCPACAKDALKKLISAVGFQLKGTGWYETDFKNKPKPKGESSGDKDGGSGAKKDDTSSAAGESTAAVKPADSKAATGTTSSSAGD